MLSILMRMRFIWIFMSTRNSLRMKLKLRRSWPRGCAGSAMR